MYLKVKLWDISKITYWKNLPTKLLKQTWYTVFWANWIIGYFDDYLYEDEMLLISCRWAYSWKINMSPKKSFITNNSLIVDLNCKDSIHKKLVYYFLQAVNKTNIITWTAQPQVTINNVLPLEIPLPSLPTQHLIVSEIEKQFSNLDEWLSSLKRAKENLKKYKASVLKSAVEWKLTQDFRKTQKLESSSILLEQILQERKNKFLSENPGKKYKEPEGIKVEDLPNIELPEGWEWCNVNYITKKQEYWSSQKADLVWDVPVLRMWNIQDWKLDFTDLKYFNKDNSDLNKLVLEDKELLFCRTNWSPELVWKTALYYKEKHPYPCSFAWYLIRVWTFNDLFKIEYLYYCLNSVYWRDYINRVKTSINQNNVSWEKLSNYIFPIPPLSEQNEIVKIVESKLSVVEKLEKLVDENIKKAENLKQSILKKAFEGELIKEEK